jgi:predicted TIM-barrel fold metal-dependent hydrolase
MGFNPIGVRAAIEMCGVDRVVFGSDFGPVPYGIKEHVQIVEDVVPSLAERQQVFWKTSNRVFRLGLVDADLSAEVPVGAHRAKLEAAGSQ